MRTQPSRRLVLLGTAAAMLAAAACSGVGPPAGPGSPVAARSMPEPGRDSAAAPLIGLVDLAVRRLEIADTVAAWKWHTHGPIDDQHREQAVIDAATAGSPARRIDPLTTAAVFRDQIEASKVVQYGLFSEWSAAPEHAPPPTGDLATVRGELDHITQRLLDDLAATRALRADTQCASAISAARTAVERAHHLDVLHNRALDRSLRSICH